MSPEGSSGRGVRPPGPFGGRPGSLGETLGPEDRVSSGPGVTFSCSTPYRLRSREDGEAERLISGATRRLLVFSTL